jgi:hypothetical protein
VASLTDLTDINNAGAQLLSQATKSDCATYAANQPLIESGQYLSINPAKGEVKPVSGVVDMVPNTLAGKDLTEYAEKYSTVEKLSDHQEQMEETWRKANERYEAALLNIPIENRDQVRNDTTIMLNHIAEKISARHQTAPVSRSPEEIRNIVFQQELSEVKNSLAALMEKPDFVQELEKVKDGSLNGVNDKACER